jgi:hypothetical protein
LLLRAGSTTGHRGCAEKAWPPRCGFGYPSTSKNHVFDQPSTYNQATQQKEKSAANLQYEFECGAVIAGIYDKAG